MHIVGPKVLLPGRWRRWPIATVLFLLHYLWIRGARILWSVVPIRGRALRCSSTIDVRIIASCARLFVHLLLIRRLLLVGRLLIMLRGWSPIILVVILLISLP